MISVLSRNIIFIRNYLSIPLYCLLNRITSIFSWVVKQFYQPNQDRNPLPNVEAKAVVPLSSSPSTISKPELLRTMVKAMVIFHNFHSRLIPDSFRPRLKEFVEEWRDVLGSAGTTVLHYFTSLESESSIGQAEIELLWKLYQQDNHQSVPHYLPFCWVENGTIYTTIMEIVEDTKEWLIFKDISNQASWTIKSQHTWNIKFFGKLLRWNQACLKGDHASHSNPLERSPDSTDLIDHRLTSSSIFNLLLMARFLKKAGLQGDKQKKLDHKIEVLKQLLSEIPGWASDAQIVEWVKGSLAHLEKSIDSLIKKNDSNQTLLQAHRRYCYQLLEVINQTRTVSCPISVPTNLSASNPTHLQFSTASPLPTPLQSPPSAPKELLFEESPLELPSEYPDFTLTHPTGQDYWIQAQALKKWVDCAEKAFEKRDFKALTTICIKYLEQLPQPENVTSFFYAMDAKWHEPIASAPANSSSSSQTNKQQTTSSLIKNLFKETYIQKNVKDELRIYTYCGNSPVNLWAIPLFQMTYFLIHTQMIQLKVSPVALKHILKGLALQKRLRVIATLQDHPFDSSILTQDLLSHVLKGFRNYAADWGEDGGEILEILKTMRKPYSLTHQGKTYHSSTSDYHRPIYSCSDQVASRTAYELSCYLDLLCNPIALTLNEEQENSGQHYRHNNQQAIDQYLEGVEQLRNGALLQLGYKKERRYIGTGYDIFPFNRISWKQFNTQSEFFKTHVGSEISNFNHLSLPVRNPHLRHFIQQGVVTTQNRLSWTGLGLDRDEFALYEDPQSVEDVEDTQSYANTFLGENKTQTVIQQEKQSIPGISSSCFQDLQLMQTSSFSRARNTLVTFEKHPYLLAHASDGRDFRTIFSLNLFRDAALYREFTHARDKIPAYFKQLDNIISYHMKRDHYDVVLFLIDTRSKMIGLLTSTLAYQKWDQTTIESLQKSQKEWVAITEDWWKEIEDKSAKPALHASKAAICQSILIYHARNQTSFTPEQVVQFLFPLALAFANSSIRFDTSEELCEKIDLYVARYLPSIVKYIQEKTPAAFVNQVIPDYRDKRWKQINETVWESETLCFQADTLTFQPHGEIRSVVPLSIRNHPILNALDPERQIQTIQRLTPVGWKETGLSYIFGSQELGWSFEFKSRGRQYQVVFHSKKQDQVRIYRKQGSQVEQFVKPEGNNRLSAACQKAFWWQDLKSQQLRIENQHGEEVYRYRDKTLWRINKGEEEEVLDPCQLSDKGITLSQLVGEKNFELIKTKKGAIIASFPTFNCRYRWDAVKKRWESEFLKGYYLYQAPLSTLLKTRAIEQKTVSLFPPSFDHYHLLEKGNDPQAPKKLVLAPISYERGPPVGESKYQWDSHPTVTGSTWGNSPHVCVFDMDSEGALSTPESTAYLYLSYLLLTQRQYLSAMTYLRLSQVVADYDRQIWETACEWMSLWRDSSVEAAAFKLHFYLTEQRLRQWRVETIEETVKNDEGLLLLMESYTTYCSFEQKIPSYLRITPADHALIQRLEPRALQRDKNGEIEKPSWSAFSEKAQNLIGQTTTAEDVIKSLLKEELDEYKKTSSPVKPQHKPLALEETIEGLLDEVSLDQVIEKRDQPPQIDATLKELKTVFNNSDKYVQEIGNRLIQDIEDYSNLERFQFKDSVNFDALKTQFTNCASKWKERRKQVEVRLMGFFQLPRRSRLEEKQFQLKDSFTTLPELIAQAQICYCENNYQPLVEKGLVLEGDCEKLDQLMDEYFSYKLMQQHWGRKLQALDDYEKKKIHEANCIETLRSQPTYDVQDASMRRTFKVAEVTLNFSIKKMQLSSLIQQIENLHSFKHAGTGAGKTALRHLLLRLKSFQNRVGGQLTHRELFHTHHRDLAAKQRSAFNTTLFPFQSTRQDRLTPYQLEQIQRRTWMALKEKGSLDHCPSDALSFKNSFITAFLDGVEWEIFEQFQQARQLHQQLLSVSSDELMAVADPSKDHNFSYGSAKHLEEVVYDTCLDLFNLLRIEDRFSPFLKLLRANQLKSLSEEAFAGWLDQLAQAIVVKEGYSSSDPSYPILWNYLRQHYLKKEHPHSLEAYQKTIDDFQPDKKERFYCLHRYFEIFSDYHLKLLGVHFGRSKDQLTTKPFRKSAYCMESAQRSDVATTIFETCFDYTAKGVSEAHITAFVETKRQKAEQETDTQESSAVSQSFHALYGLDLWNSVIPVKNLAQQINSSGEKIKDFLKTTLFSRFTYFPKKVEGTSSHLPNQYYALSGSSASADRIGTLPHAIKRTPEMMRQKGDIGEKFYQFMTHFNPDQDMIAVNSLEPIAPQVGPHLKEGDVLIDLAPFFPGEPAEAIATDLATQLQPQGQDIRFIDENGKLKTLRNAEATTEMTGVLSHLHTEGTDWKFNNGVITHSKQTSLTEFYQGMRMRELGRGQQLSLASDVNWVEIEAKYPELKEKSLLTQIIYLQVANESNSLKKLHYLRLIKDIYAIPHNAIDNLLKSVHDSNTYKQLRVFPTIQRILAPTYEVNVKQWGALRQNGTTTNKLLLIAREQIDQLQQVQEEIKQLAGTSSLLIQAIEQLTTIDSILLPAYQLPDSITSTDSIEELEVEIEQNNTLSQEVLQEIELELDMAVHQTVAQENEEFYQRSVSDAGRELVATPFEEALSILLKQPSIHPPETFAIDGFSDRLLISAHALGYPSGSRVSLPIKTRFWFENHSERLVMGHEIAFLSTTQEPNLKKIAVIMSVKDADLFLQKHTLKQNLLQPGQKVENGWLHTPTGAPNSWSVSRFKPSRPWENLIDWQVWNVYDTEFPDWADEDDRRAMVFAKIVFVDCKFSLQQLQIAKDILSSQPDSHLLKSKLQKFLQNNGIDSHQHPLFQIL